MNTNPNRSFRDFAEDTAELAARAIALGLSRLIVAYVPGPLANQFATRVAILLVREVHFGGDDPPVIFRA